MLDTAAIAELARPILQRAVAPGSVADVRVQEMADLDGEAALDVLAIADAVRADSVDALADASVALQQALQGAGETRYAFVRFTTAHDLAEGDAEGDDA